MRLSFPVVAGGTDDSHNVLLTDISEWSYYGKRPFCAVITSYEDRGNPMITGADPDTSHALVNDGLPLMGAMPTALPDHAPGDLDHEGPLALDYRTWADAAHAPTMGPDDVTYTLRWTKVSYDGRVYKYAWASVDDK